MIVMCEWELVEELVGPTNLYRCTLCGQVLPLYADRPTHAACKTSPVEDMQLLLGDRIVIALTSIGYTKERHMEVVNLIRGHLWLKPLEGCGCSARRLWLNRQHLHAMRVCGLARSVLMSILHEIRCVACQP